MLDRDFVVKAKKDGYIKEYDEETQILILEYKDGTHDAIDLSPKISFNGGKLLSAAPNKIFCLLG